MTNIPNLITILRIIGSLSLLLTPPLSPTFLFIYILCGGSDILDGYLARKYQLSSALGALLDSIADAIMILIVLYLMIPQLQLSTLLKLWLALIVVIRLSSLFIGLYKFHSLAFLHTYGNKLTGFLLFCFPVFGSLFGFNPTLIFLAIIATVSAFEELLINLKQNTLNRNIKSFLDLNN